MEVTLHVSVSEHVSNAYTVAIRAKNVNYWPVFVEICFRKGGGVHLSRYHYHYHNTVSHVARDTDGLKDYNWKMIIYINVCGYIPWKYYSAIKW